MLHSLRHGHVLAVNHVSDHRVERSRQHCHFVEGPGDGLVLLEAGLLKRGDHKGVLQHLLGPTSAASTSNTRRKGWVVSKENRRGILSADPNEPKL